ncbi:hypothetical protein L6164_032624 [Bauhinia variegata]|uniref:Uncharacterized protein n=1 Tax=Bauhinia variegata TaxID=167791 RepID=A0ACB9KPD0_BAUVA|nr:hypothetical protein L6164_032624 [Bauhinia variegata]
MFKKSLEKIKHASKEVPLWTYSSSSTSLHCSVFFPLLLSRLFDSAQNSELRLSEKKSIFALVYLDICYMGITSV